jgi:hypothetical protein
MIHGSLSLCAIQTETGSGECLSVIDLWASKSVHIKGSAALSSNTDAKPPRPVLRDEKTQE